MSRDNKGRTMQREPRAGCPRCGHAGYSVGATALGRPEFTCGSCGNKWTSGDTGGRWDSKEGATCYYVCTKCHHACDAVREGQQDISTCCHAPVHVQTGRK